MNIETLHEQLEELQTIIRNNGLKATCAAHVNWIGDEMSIDIEAAEPYDENGYWSHSRSFGGEISEAETLLRDASNWVYALPDEESRAIELMVQKLNKIADQLPKGASDVAVAAWKEIHAMLMNRAERIAQNGLPSPARISTLTAS